MVRVRNWLGRAPTAGVRMPRARRIAAACALGSIATIGCAQGAVVPVIAPADAGPTGGVGERIDEYLTRTVPFGVSGAVLVADGEHVLVARGYGLADRERGVPVRLETAFDVASVTKQFTAGAILKLQAEGRVAVTDSLHRFFSSVPADKRSITLHHLLTHTAGLPDMLGRDHDVIGRDSLVTLALQAPLSWRPGARSRYCNLCYSLLAAVVEQASGRGYEQYLHDALFVPAGMHSTGYAIPRWADTLVARGYLEGVTIGSPLAQAWAPDGPGWHLRGNGGMLSTVGDLYRWVRALHGGLLPDSLRTLLLCEPLVSAADWGGGASRGYGCDHRPSRWGPVVGHGGNSGFFSAALRVVPATGVVVIALYNEEESFREPITRDVMALAHGATDVAMPPRRPEGRVDGTDLGSRWAGSYKAAGGSRVSVVADPRGVLLRPGGQEIVDLLQGVRPSPRSTERARAANMKAHTLIAGLQNGELEALRAISSPDRFDGRRRLLDEVWTKWASEGAPVRGFEVIGTVVAESPADTLVRTFVRLDRGTHTTVFRLTWDGDLVSAFGFDRLDAFPNEVLAVPRGAGLYEAFFPGAPGVVEVELHRGGGEQGVRIELRGSAGAWSAARR